MDAIAWAAVVAMELGVCGGDIEDQEQTHSTPTPTPTPAPTLADHMADPLYEVLAPYFDVEEAVPRPDDQVTSGYINRLTTLSLESLTSTEPQSLSQSTSSVFRSLQALSKRSHKAIIASSDHLASLKEILPRISGHASQLQDALPELESSAQGFTEKYGKSLDKDNEVLDRRKKAMLLARNADRVSDVLELPSLLSSAISASAGSSQAAGPVTSTNASYTSALELHAQIKRLHSLYPNLNIVTSISGQAEQEMKGMTTNLITSLQTQGIKLAGAMRTIGYLRRIAPELDDQTTHTNVTSAQKLSSLGNNNNEGSLGALFLVCRLTNLISMLQALDPLKELADQETAKPSSNAGKRADAETVRWLGGQQTEKYLKRYLEIFREQSFSIISMYKSIFPSALPAPDSVVSAGETKTGSTANTEDALRPLPSALATFPMHLVELLFETLRIYLPNVRDRSSRDSLLTQVLYCAGSLGRLGGDFGMMLALLEEELVEGADDEQGEYEWVEVVKKHRIQASRLELLASGVGTGRKEIASLG